MNVTRILVVSGLSMLLCSMIWPAQARASGDGVSAEDFDRLEEAREVYYANCAACHGFDGVPMMPGVPNFAAGERMEKGEQALLASIENGKESESGGVAMPPWKEALDEEEIHLVLNYLQVIQGDTVFQEHCIQCHGSSVPPVADSIPDSVEKLKQYEGPLNVCTGVQVESLLEREDIISAIQFLIGVSGDE